MGIFDGILNKVAKYKILNVEFNKSKTICIVDYSVLYFGKEYFFTATIFIVNIDRNILNNSWVLTGVLEKNRNIHEKKHTILSLKTKKEIYDAYVNQEKVRK